jgi:hypothetical protein
MDQFVLQVVMFYDKINFLNNKFHLEFPYDVSGDNVGDIDEGAV